jgi:Fic family protein
MGAVVSRERSRNRKRPVDNHNVTLYGFMIIYESTEKKKASLDKHRPLPEDLARNLEEWFRIELTYTSNAIEGNTLTRRETALVVEKGITVGGKTLAEHLEASNHAEALDWVKAQVKRKPHQISVHDMLRIHNLILKGIDDAHAGHFRSVPVRVSGSTVVFPNPRKVPDLMDELCGRLSERPKLHPIELAAEAHYRLVTIHPFVDGNGRTARLLMDMILMMNGYPPAIIRKRDRLSYIDSLEKAQLGGSKEAYLRLIGKSVNRSLDIYLKAVLGTGEGASETDSDILLKIGELAKRVEEPNSTIRHWTKEGLLEVAATTASGYQMYSVDMIRRVEAIKALKKKRLTLEEIKIELSK